MQKLLTFFSAKILAYMPYLMIKVFLQMQKLLTFFSAKILAYMPYLMIKVLTFN